MNGFLVVFRKEVVENLRDRRALFNSVLLSPLLFPLLLLGMSYLAISTQEERAEKPLAMPVIGAEHAPNLVAFLRQNGVTVEEPVDDVEQRVRSQEVTMAMRIPSSFAEDWAAGRPATVELIADPTRGDSQSMLARTRSLLHGYGRQIGTLRMQLRGVSPLLSSPIAVREIDLSTPRSRAMLLLAILPYALMITAFVGGMHLAIDVTAGERERRSLEPLLINPVPRWQIMCGKMAATAAFALASLLLTLLSFKLSLPLMPIDQLGVDLNVPLGVAAKILAVVAPVAVLAASMLTLLASFAKSFREAQSYMGLVVLIPMIPSLLFMSNQPQPETWMMPIPLFSQNILIGEFVRGEAVPSHWLWLSGGGTLALGLALGLVAAFLYRRPALVFQSG
jgi:sodium transport system permease protein